MPKKSLIDISGKKDIILELGREGYTSKEISLHLLTQGVKIPYQTIARFLKSEGISRKDILDKKTTEEKISKITYEIPVIDTVKLLKELSLPNEIDTQEKAIECLQKTLLKETFDTWCILTTFKKEYILGKIDYYPSEIEKHYLMLLDRCEKWLGMKVYVDENEALKIVENIGLEVRLKETLE